MRYQIEHDASHIKFCSSSSVVLKAWSSRQSLRLGSQLLPGYGRVYCRLSMVMRLGWLAELGFHNTAYATVQLGNGVKPTMHGVLIFNGGNTKITSINEPSLDLDAFLHCTACSSKLDHIRMAVHRLHLAIVRFVGHLSLALVHRKLISKTYPESRKWVAHSTSIPLVPCLPVKTTSHVTVRSSWDVRPYSSVVFPPRSNHCFWYKTTNYSLI